MKYSFLKVWEKVIGWPLPYEFAECFYNGRMLRLSEEKACYVFLDNDASSLCLTFFDRKGVCEEKKIIIPKRILLPTHWNIKREQDSWYIYCDEEYQFEITTQNDVRQISLKSEVLSRRNLLHLSQDPFIFDRFMIEHKGAFGFVCTDTVTKEKLWTLKAQGYLYSDIRRIGDRLFICTAEHGGFVYCVNILTGEILY